MTKLQFLLALHDKLASLPQKEVEERLNFYSEIIEDRIEVGMPEEEAVAAVGSIYEIATQITADIPLVKASAGQADKLKDAREALLVLGYSRSEIAASLKDVDMEGSLEDIIRDALQALMK